MLHRYSLGVLAVGQVHERQVTVILWLSTSRALSLLTLLLLVLPDETESKDDKDTELEAVGNEDGSDTELVLGCLLGLVEEGRGDVTDTCAEPDDATDDHALGHATDVGGDKTEGKHERALVGPGEVAGERQQLLSSCSKPLTSK
jgi:hypothetical protein